MISLRFKSVEDPIGKVECEDSLYVSQRVSKKGGYRISKLDGDENKGAHYQAEGWQLLTSVSHFLQAIPIFVYMYL